MIILDTNVVSEPLKLMPNEQVVQWLDAQTPDSLFLTTISLAELHAGVDLLPDGQRKLQLRESLGGQLTMLFQRRLLPFDELAAEAFARIQTRARAAGNVISFPDCAIAALADRHGYLLATRNVRDFRGTNIRLINPWDGKGCAAQTMA